MYEINASTSQGFSVKGTWFFYYDNGTVLKAENLITQSGLNYLASILVNEKTNDVPMHLALGTGTASAKLEDVKLGNEGIRKVVSSKQRQGNMARIRAFFQAHEANGDWTEFGIFLSGTSTKDSGVLLNRLVTPISKASNQVLSVECRITISAS